jgi:hypothetical protein
MCLTCIYIVGEDQSPSFHMTLVFVFTTDSKLSLCDFSLKLPMSQSSLGLGSLDQRTLYVNSSAPMLAKNYCNAARLGCKKRIHSDRTPMRSIQTGRFGSFLAWTSSWGTVTSLHSSTASSERSSVFMALSTVDRAVTVGIFRRNCTTALWCNVLVKRNHKCGRPVAPKSQRI